jgi:hypothetical protein
VQKEPLVALEKNMNQETMKLESGVGESHLKA